MSKVLWLALVFSLSFAKSNAHDAPSLITFSSDTRLSKNEFFYLSDLSQHQYVNKHVLQKAKKLLLGKQRFSSVTITKHHGRKKRVHFNITSHWLFKKIQLSGIWFGKYQYEDLYLQHPGDVFDITRHEQSIENIQQKLYEQGYYLCDIDDELVYNKTYKTIGVKLHIKRNKKFIIDQVSIVNNALSTYQKNKILKTYVHVLSGRHYAKHKILQVKRQLIAHFEKKGYPKVRIAIKQHVDKQNKKVHICFFIQLGTKRHFIFSGNTFFSDAKLRSTVLNPQQPEWLFSPNIICEQLEYLYEQHGFFRVKVTYKTDKNNEIIFLIHEGPQDPAYHISNHDSAKDQYIASQKPNVSPQYFGKIYLQGNLTIPFNAIMKAIPFKQGEPWNTEKITYARKQLRSLDMFQYIHIQPLKLCSDNKRPIKITLLEDDPLELRFRLGYLITSKNFLFKRASTPKFGASIILKNPCKQADKLFITSDISNFERNTVFAYQIPHFLVPQVTGKWKLYSHKYVHPLAVGSSNAAYESMQHGCLLGLRKEYEPHHFWGINVGSEWNRTSRVRGDMNLSSNLINRTIPYTFLEPNVVIDKLDNRLFPRNGTLSIASMKCMVPLMNRSWLYKIMIDHTYIHPLWKDIILAIRIRWGHIFNEHFNQIMPTERFFLGGPISVRGYDKDALPPLGRNHTIQGGSSMINGNAELRIPLIHKTLDGVVFQDIGVLSQAGFSGFKGVWYPTTGCGLRYHTPIGALRFDIGWKWKRSFQAEPSYAWYLALGQAF